MIDNAFPLKCMQLLLESYCKSRMQKKVSNDFEQFLDALSQILIFLLEFDLIN